MDTDPNNLTPAKVRERWEKGVRATRQERQEASVNAQFIRNRHWVYWNRGADRLEEVPRNPERVRATIARIGPDTRVIMAKLTRRPLQFEVPPTAPDDAAMKGSRTSESVLAQVAREQNWEGIRIDHANVTWEAGVGGIAVEWDSDAGTVIQADEMGNTVRTGDVKVSCVSLHEMSFEPGTRDGEKARWWCRGQALPPPEVQDLYGLSKEPKSDARALEAIHRVESGDRSQDTPLTMVYSYYQRPSRTMPNGRIVTVVGDEFVADSEWTFPWDDHLNISLAVGGEIHAQWFGSTPVTDAVPIQAAYNASWSSIIEHMKNAGNARLWVPMGAVDDIEDLSDQSGEAVEYNPMNGNLRPVYESPPSMPDWWIRQPQMLEGALDNVLSVHAISRGDAPTGVESGRAMAILAENDDTPLGGFARNLGNCWGRAASNILKLYEARVTESREALVTMPGKGSIPEKMKWVGGDLAGQTTAIVPVDAVMPRNRAAQAAYAFDLNDRGIVTDPELLARIADLPDQHDLLEGISPDSARAHRENMWMSGGKPRTVEQYDDHLNHLRILRDYMRSERYENHPDEVKQIFLWHAQAHEMYAAGKSAEEVQAAGISPMAAVLPTLAPDVIPLEMLGGAAAAPGGPPPSPVPAAGTEPPPEEEDTPEDQQEDTEE